MEMILWLRAAQQHCVSFQQRCAKISAVTSGALKTEPSNITVKKTDDVPLSEVKSCMFGKFQPYSLELMGDRGAKTLCNKKCCTPCVSLELEIRFYFVLYSVTETCDNFL